MLSHVTGEPASPSRQVIRPLQVRDTPCSAAEETPSKVKEVDVR
jgi:hypothetical protein